MAAAPSVAGSKSNAVSDEERRWVVVGICLTKVLTPALRDVLANEIPKCYQVLLQPPCEIDKQTFVKRQKVLPPSTLKLNYDSINNNTAHKSPRTYDYAVKDPLSLAKLFMKPFMANFTGFDQTMDTSAVLSVLCEAPPFIASGAAGVAKKVRSDIRNEWAHCNFSHWTDPNFQAALQSMVSLIKKVNLTPVEEKRVLDELDDWKSKGVQLCFGQAVDPALLKLINTEVAELNEAVKLWKEDIEYDQSQLLNSLEMIKGTFTKEIEYVKERQELTEKRVDCLESCYNATVKNVEKIKNELSKIPDKTVFMAPKTNRWFSGREAETQELRAVLEKKVENGKDKVIVSAVCGLGGSGKTSLVAEYAQQMKDHYQGGVFWFSGEDDEKLADSVNYVGIRFETFQNHSFDTTLTRTLAAISRIQKPWLMVLDDMDELNISKSVLMLVSGPWQQDVSALGHLIITTRRKPQALVNDIRGYEESCSLKLECFAPEEAKVFVFRRTEIACDEKSSLIADSLIKKLGGLPLALEQACAYIKSLGCSLSSYLDLYNKQSLQLLSKQKVTPVSVYGSQERLSVLTTWLLNFEHISKNENGMVAIRFLNACAFINPNEIQQELINVGEPLVDDEAFRDFVSTSLGSRQVIKLLTDFSLFKEARDSCLNVHRLVQEVIQENLNPEEKAESIVDAVRLLRFAFSQCPSPDDLTSVVNELRERPSIRSTDPSLFYKWHKLCLHSYELLKNVKALVDSSCRISDKTVFFPETARIVYECALHLNVNGNSSEAITVADFANRIFYWDDDEVSEEKLKTLFPHTVPLPELVQRYIRYSCRGPIATNKPRPDDKQISDDSEKSESIEKMRLEGNELFKKSLFKESIGVYTSAINMSKGTNLFDPRLLTNRASAYYRLKQYDNALKDAEDYVAQCPDCWKGYARKALALEGLDKKLDAKCAAALAYYRERNVFRQFPPFKTVFPTLEKCISICHNPSSLSDSLPFSPFGSGSIDNKIIVLASGEYRLSTENFDRYKCPGTANQLLVNDCIMLGVENIGVKSGVTFTFIDDFGIRSQSCMAVNISFIFDKGSWHAGPNSDIKISNCSFSCSNQDYPAFLSAGILNVKNSSFENCKGTGLCVVAGNAEVDDSVFSGNENIGLAVQGGNLVVKKSKMHGNKLGLHIASSAAKCCVLDCQIYDNSKQGIGVTETTDVRLRRNRIFHNDRHGIFLDNRSFALIEQNEIFENCWLGIDCSNNSWCHISRNKIHHNKCGGVHVAPLSPELEVRHSVVEYNKIFGNAGPGIDETATISDIPDTPSSPGISYHKKIKYIKTNAIREQNELNNNEEQGCPPASKDVFNICSLCRTKGRLKKCDKCYSVGYCNKECKNRHLEKHKSSCPLLLERSSVVMKVLPKCYGAESARCDAMVTFSKYGKRIIVKIQACDVERKSNHGGSLLTVNDHKMTLNGDLENSRIYELVRQCGFNCKLYGWKKMYMWAFLRKNGMLRVFINEFPNYPNW